MRFIKAASALVIISGLIGAPAVNARPVLPRPAQQPVPEVQKLSEEKRSELQAVLTTTGEKLAHLRSLAVRDVEVEKNFQALSSRFGEMSGDYRGQNIDSDVSDLLVQIQLQGQDIDNRITMAKRMHLLYMLMATFGLFIITAITIYYATMYLRRRR